MGDRGNIVIEDSGQKPLIYFYTHWSGSGLPKLVIQALIKARERWLDTPYLNRVLFQTMLEKDNGITGFGIDVAMGDGGTEVYVCPDRQTVRYDDKTYSFTEFTQASF